MNRGPSYTLAGLCNTAFGFGLFAAPRSMLGGRVHRAVICVAAGTVMAGTFSHARFSSGLPGGAGVR